MEKDYHHLLAIILVLIFGFGLFYIGTDGFRAFTAESARIIDLKKENPVVPTVLLEDSRGRTYPLDSFKKGKLALVTFMYTNCGTVCPQLEMNMAKVYQAIPKQYIGKDIVFLSISFDTKNDDPKTLAKYRTYFGSDGETWRMARINNQSQLQLLLDTLGVIVIPDGTGNFTHNAAFYLIGDQGHLLDVMDYTKIEEAATNIKEKLDRKAG